MKRARILIIDDEYVTLAMLEDFLVSRGFEVFKANRAAEGIQKAVFDHPDLILLDIILPDRDGFSVLEDLKKNERTRHIPVVLISALSDSTALKTEAAAAFLHKPIVQHDVIGVIERILAGS